MAESLFMRHYYSVNRISMQVMGIWPDQPLALRIILPSFFIGTIGSILVPEIVRMHDVWGNMDKVIEGLPAMIIISASWVKLINGVLKRPAVIQLIRRIDSDWQALAKYPSSVVILKKYAEQGRFLSLLYTGFVACTTTAFITLPVIPLVLNVIIPLNESRTKKYLYEAEYGVDPEKYYYYMLFHSYLTSYMCMGLHAFIDTTVSCWIQHCCALFAIVSYNLEYASKEMDREISKENPEKNAEYSHLCLCIRQHKEAITYANLIESTYYASLAYITVANMLVMSISGVLVIIKIDDFEDILRFLVLTIAPVFHLFFNTVPGQRLTDHSLLIGEAAYQCDWTEFSIRAQKLLIVLIARGQCPCSISAGKFYVINMESFSAVMRATISYFTAFSSIRFTDSE